MEIRWDGEREWDGGGRGDGLTERVGGWREVDVRERHGEIAKWRDWPAL